MSKIKQFIKNISPLNNRTEMPIIFYIIKVILIFWFVKFGAEIIGEGIVIAICFACGKNPLRGEMFSTNIMMLMMYYGYFVLIGIMLLYWKLFQKKTLSELGFTRKAGSYIIGVVTGTVLVVISVLLIVFTGAISYNGVFDNIDFVFILLMFAGLIFQGAMEEILCRGIVMQLLIKKTNIPVTILISSMLFIIPHLFNIEKVSGGIIFFTIVNLFLISIVFSLLTIYFKNIWVACGFHTVWNFILYNIFGMNLSGNDEIKAAVFDMRSVGSNILNGGIYGIEASVVTGVVLAITVVIMIFIMKRKAL